MSESGPSVSVILPTYNRAAILPDAVRSVLDQSFTSLELIVADDSSTDATPAALAAFGDPRLRVLRLPERGGAAMARNAALAVARAEWIAFQDSDDRWLPGKLSKQMALAAMAPAEVGVIYTSYLRRAGAQTEILPRPGPGRRGDVLATLARGNFITTQTLLVRKRELLAVGGFDKAGRSLDDWALCLKLARRCRFEWIPEALVDYTLRDDSVTRDHETFIVSYEHILAVNADLMLARPAQAAWHWAAIGNRLCREGSAARGRPYLVRACRNAPWDARYWGAWVLSWLGARAYRRIMEGWRRVV